MKKRMKSRKSSVKTRKGKGAGLKKKGTKKKY